MSENRKNWQECLADFWMSAITKRRWLTLITLAILLGLALLGVARVEFDDSWENWLLDEDPVMKDTERFNQVFGEKQQNFVLVEPEHGVFTTKTLQYLDKVTKELKEHLPFVDSVMALPNMQHIKMVGDNLVIEELIPGDIPTDDAELASIEEEVKTSKGALGHFITRDGKGTAIIISLKSDFPEEVYVDVEGRFNHLAQEETMDKVVLAGDVSLEEREGMARVTDPIMLIRPALNAILAEHTPDDIKVTPTGMAIIVFERELLLTEEMSTLMGLAIISAAALMFIIFRGFRPMLGAVLVMILTIIFLFGAQGWLDIPLAMQSLIVMMLAMVIAVGYSIHFINHFLRKFLEEGNRQEAIYHALRQASWPILITAFTTAMGFFATLVIPSETIRVVGLNCAAAALLTYFLVMTVVPLLFILGRDREPTTAGKKRNQAWQRFMVGWAELVIKNGRAILIGSGILVLILGYGLTQVEISTDTHGMIGDRMEFIRDANHVAEQLGYLYAYHIFIELPKEGMGQKSEVMQGVHDFQREIEGYPGTTATGSVVDLLKKMHMTMNQGNPDYYTLPQDDDLIAQYLLLYEMGGGEGLEDRVDFPYKNLNITVQLGSTSHETLQRVLEIGERGEEFFPAGIKVSPVGDIAMFSRSLSFLTIGQINSIAVALAGIALIMILILKSIRTGLISMLGNGLPVLAILGTMGLMKVPLDLVTVLISPMVIGIAVDDTVHYFLHFKKEFYRCGSYREANRETFRKIGKALTSTTAVLVLGFLIMSMIDIKSFTYVGLMAALGIFVALFADLVIAPPLLVNLKPFGPEKEGQKV